MISAFVEAMVKGVTNRNDYTVSKIVNFSNHLFILLFVTSNFFPLKDIFLKYLNVFDIELISDAALVMWYCATFLFLISTFISIASYLVYLILEKAEKKFDYKKITANVYTLFCAARSAYSSIFDYIALSTFILLFVAPGKLLSAFETYLWTENILKIIFIFFVVPGAIDCVISMLIFSAIKWIMPDYYNYKNIADEIYKDG